MVAVPLPGLARGGGGHCDFDGDGYDDVAIGVQMEDVGAHINAGAVNVLYGSVDKLTSVGNQFWTQDQPGMGDSAEFGDFFGQSVECGDFNDDGFDDAVFSAPKEDIAGEGNAGGVHMLFGSASGLTAVESLFLYRDAAGVAAKGEADDFFGWSLAVGDFDGDGHDDLAVGVPSDSVKGTAGAGSVQVFYGFAGGLSTGNDEVWHRGKNGVRGALEVNASFGRSLAAGDFDGDGRDDLAIGAPFDDIGASSDAGSVSVLYGSNSGLIAAGNDLFHRSSKGIRGTAETSDRFGWSVVAGDFDGDGRDELAVGVPLDDVEGVRAGGSVHVIRGSSNGLTPDGNRIWHRNQPGVMNTVAARDHFGSSLTTGRFDSGNEDDLAVGVFKDSFAEAVDAGSVHVLYGSNTGLTGAGDQIWHQARMGIKGANQSFDRFGLSVSTGDFDDNSRDDLLVGVPFEGSALFPDSGRVVVIYGRSGGLEHTGSQSWSQDSPGILDATETGDQMGYSVNGHSPFGFAASDLPP